MRVDSWFSPFFVEFVDSHAYYPWPEAGTEELARVKQDWKDTFIDRGINKEVAEKTRLRLASEDLKAFGNVLARFMVVAKEVQKERAAAANPDAVLSDRDSAAAASASCQDCAGNGLTTRYRHQAVGDGLGRNAAGFAMAFYCTCPLGRFTESNHAKKDTFLHRSIPDLRKHPTYQLHPADWTEPPGLLDNAYRYPPESWNPIDRRPTVEAARFDGGWKRRYDAERTRTKTGPRPAFAPKPAAPLTPPAEPIRPALTHNQSTLLAALGPHWSQEFKGLAPHVQREILASARDSFSNETLTAAVDRIRDESETVLF